MCTTCGCSNDDQMKIVDVDSGSAKPANDAHSLDHAHEHSHDHVNHHYAHEHSHDHVNHHLAHEHSHDHGHHHHAHDHSHEQEHHSHAQDHSHDHEHHQTESEHVATRSATRRPKVISLEQEVLAKNSLFAQQNRDWLKARSAVVINLVSSPGSGKTTLLEKTIRDLKGQAKISVIEGDQETARDAQRIESTGCAVVQINTGAGCHLEADIVGRALKELAPPDDSLVFIENVGNLVCPALFDLGEKCKVVILSVTEGDDKPLKYPHMFRASSIMIINKIDLLPYVDFDVDSCIKHAKEVNPEIQTFEVSVKTGAGLSAWYQWLNSQIDPELHPSG